MKLKNILALMMIVFITATFSGCAKKKKSVGTDTAGPSVTDDPIAGIENADSDSGNAMGLKTVNFPFDSTTLTQSAKMSMKSNAKMLKDVSSVKVQIEGHCDERGGIQYNLSLGEKRGQIVKQYMVDLGINSNRITTISYGKERPLVMGSNEAAWAANRRANFAITSK